VITLVLVQGGTPYYANVLQIAGTPVTIKWANNTTPTPAATITEIQTFTLLYISSTWTAFGQYTSFS
jgi:hypothetical protein